MSISRKFQRSKSKYTLSQKIISAVTAAGFIMQPFTAFAGEIIKHNNPNTNLINDKVANIWADRVVDKTAVNVFNKFNLSQNEIANMYFGLKDTKHDAANLVNFVNDRIDINGTVNAIQNSQIGGNLFFLSKDGMAVGKSGVINTGSLYVMTPTADYIDNMKIVAGTADAATAANELNAITNITKDANAWQVIPVNTSGTITVLGKVNATNEVQMRAAKIGVGKNVSGEDLHDGENDAVGTIKDGVVNSAYIKTGVTKFSDIVNTVGMDISDVVLDIEAPDKVTGNIVLSAYVDGATEKNDLEELPVVGATLGPIAETVENTFVEQDFNASVDVYGTVATGVETTEKKGNININATAVNSNAAVDKSGNYIDNDNTDVAQLANVKAEVNIDGTVQAADNVTVKAEAINRYIDNSGAFAKANIAIASGTPITGDVAYSVLNTEANVNITSDGSVESENGNVDIDAKAETLAASAASVTALKFKAAGGTTGANVPAVSVLYTGADNKANVTVEGNVNAAKDISIDADADMKVDAENKMGIKGKMGNQFVVGVTVAGAENSASVDIKDEITAGNDLSVNANATSDFTSGTSIKAPEASAMAVAVNVTDFNSNANVNIDTDLTAGNDLTVKADNIITDDNVIAESTIGSGKYVSAATQVVTGHVEQKKGEVKEWIGTLAGKISAKLQGKLSGSDDADIPSLQLSEIFKAGATVNYSGQTHGSNVTIGENTTLNAGKKMDIDALTKIEDAHITATGTTASYNDAYPAEATLNAAVLVNNMDNSSSVVVEDAVTDEKGEHKATISATDGVDINASTRFEYNRIKNMIQDVKDAAKQIASAVDDLDDSIKNDFNGFIDTLKKQIETWERAFSTADETLATSDKGVLAIGEAATAGYNVLTALNNLNTMLDNRGSEVAADTKAAIQGASDLLTSALAFADPNSYGNFAASSASKGSSGDTGSIAGHHSSAVNGAGTVMVNTVNSVSKVEIGSNAVINAVGKVELNAENYMKDVSLGGLNTVPLTNSGGGTAASIGATVNYSDFNTDTIVAVNDGASISGGDINIAGSNEIDHVSVAGGAGMGPSDETGSKGIVLNGMLSFVNGSSDILTVVDDGASLTAEPKQYTETVEDGSTEEIKTSTGNISISGHNDTNIVNVAAGLNLGSGSGAVGMGLAYNDFAVKNIAGVADVSEQINALYTTKEHYTDENGEDAVRYVVDENKVKELNDKLSNNYTASKADNGSISAYGFNVDAATEGSIQSVSVAASASKNDDTGETSFFGKIKGSISNTENKLLGSGGKLDTVTGRIFGTESGKANDFFNMGKNTHGGNGGIKINNESNGKGGFMPSFSIAGSGSVSMNMLDNATQAIVDNAKITINDKGDVNVTARDASYAGAYSGAAALQWKSGGSASDKSVGFSGAAGVNDITNKVNAVIKKTAITNAGELNTMALSGGEQLALGLGLNVVKSGNTSGYSGNAAVSVNLIDHDVEALHENNTVLNTNDVNVAAYARDIENTGGGSLSAGQQRVGIGASVGVAMLNNNISAGIKGGRYTNVGSVEVDALNALKNITVGVAAGLSVASGSGTGATVEGAGVYNEVHNTTNAFIEGSKDNKVVISTVDGGSVNVVAQDVAIDASLLNEVNDNEGSETKIADYEQALNELADGEAEIKNRMGEDFDITGSNELNGIDMSDAITQTGGNIDIDKDGGSSIITVAAGLAGSTNKGAGGAAVAITDIENTYTSKIDYAEITAETVSADAGSNSNIVTVAGGIAAASKGSGVGSVSWNDVVNTANVDILNSTVNAQSTTAKANNTAQIVSVGGQISGAGKAAVGATLSYVGLDNSTEVNITNTTFDKRDKAETDKAEADDTSVTAEANNTSDSYNIGAGVSAGGTASVSGTVVVTQTKGTAGAVMDGAKINNAKEIIAHASDDTDILSVIGTVNIAGKAAVGAGVAYTEIGGVSDDKEKAEQHVTAEIKNSTINTDDAGSTVEVKAEDEARVINVAVGVGGAANAAVQGASATTLINKETSAGINSTNIDAGHEGSTKANVTVDAQNSSEITSSASTVAVAGSGAGVGAGIAVNRIIQQTNAAVTGGTMNVNNLKVNANATPRIENIGVGGGIAGQGAGISGSVAVNMIENDVTAHIGSGANIEADGSVGVVATSDEQIANYAGQLAVGGIGAGVGVSVSVNQIAGTTSATVGGEKEDATSVVAKGNDSLTTDTVINVDINDDEKSEIHNTLIDDETVAMTKVIDRQNEERSGLIVDASSTRDLKSFLITAGVAGEGAGVTGTVNVNMIDGKTTAGITNTNVNGGSTAAVPGNNANVTVNAGDYSNMSGFVGSAAVGGIGAGVGLASDTNTINRKVTASVDKSDIKAQGFEVDADSAQGISSFGVGAGAAGVGGGAAGVVTVTELNNTTKAMLNNSKVNANTVSIKANHTGIVNAGNVSLGGAGLGVGAGLAVGVLKDNSITEVTVKGNDAEEDTITASGDVTIAATNTAVVKPVISANGVGVFGGVAGATSINNLNSTVKTNIEGVGITSTGGSISGTADNTFNVKAYMGTIGGGAVGAGAGVTVNTIDSTVQTNVNGSALDAAKDVTLTAKETRNIKQLATNYAAGGAAAGANIAITNVGQAVKNDENSNSKAADKIADANKVYGEDNKDAVKLLEGAGSALDTAKIDTGKATPHVDAELGGGKDSQITVNITNSNIEADNNVTAKATETDNITMTLGSASVAAGAAVNAGVGILNVHRNVGVNITGAEITAAKAVELASVINGSSNLDVYQGTVSILGVNAAYGGATSDGTSGVTISSGTIDGGSINILAEDAGRTDVDAIGITAGVVSAGAIVAEGTNQSQTAVNVSNTKMNSDADIDIKAERQAKDSEGNTTDAEGNKYASLNINATAGSGGLLGAGAGLGAVAEEKGSVKVNLDEFSTLTAGEALNINAFNAPVVNVSATSGAGSLIAAASVTYAKANIDMDTEVNVDGYTTLVAGSGENEGINISAEADAAQNVEMEAIGVAIGGAGQANAAEVNITSDVKVDIADNTAFKAKEENVDVNIKADNTATQSANAYGLAVSGLVASGTNLGKTNSNLKTTVDLEGSWYDSGIDNLTANAHSKVDISNYVNGDGGALLDVSPYAAKTENSVISNTNVNIGGNWDITGDMVVEALHENEIDLNADALKAAVAGLSGVHANNKVENITGVKFSNAEVTTGGSQDITARNTVDYTNTVKGSGYGAVSGAAVLAEDDMDLTANVELANSTLNAEESITVNALTGDAGYNPDGEPLASVDKEVTIKSAGVIAGTDAISTDNIDFINNIKVDKDSSVATVGKEIDKADITFTAADRTNFTDIVTADTQGGVVGASGSVLNNNFNRKNTITVEGTVDKDNSYTVDKDNSYTVDSNHDANFDAGNTSVLNLTLKSNAYNKTAAPIATNPTINGIMKQTSSINFTAGKAVESLRNINVAAGEGDTTIAKESKMWRWVTGGETGTGSIASTVDGELSPEDADVTTSVTVDGELVAGKNNELTITITDDGKEAALKDAIEGYNGGEAFGTAEGALITAQKDYDAFVKKEGGLEDKSQDLAEAQNKYENNKTAYDIFFKQGETIQNNINDTNTKITDAKRNLSAVETELKGTMSKIEQEMEKYNDSPAGKRDPVDDINDFIDGLNDVTSGWYNNDLYNSYETQTNKKNSINEEINTLNGLLQQYNNQKAANDKNLEQYDIVKLREQIAALTKEIYGVNGEGGIVNSAEFKAVKEALNKAEAAYDAALKEGFSEENINKNIFGNAGSDQYVSINASPWFEDLYGSPAEKIGMAAYASALLERYGQLADMMQEYAGTDVSKTYSDELARVQGELQALGIGRYENGVFAVTENSIVPTIELQDLNISGGDINISGGSLSGKGTMTANGNPTLTIDNQSNFFLKVNNITVDNDGGSIVYNNTSINGSHGDIAVNADTGGNGAQVNISSSENVAAKDSPYYTPDIGVFGTIYNPYGDIKIYNQYNSIYVAGKVDGDTGVLQEAGSVKGRTVTLTAGGAVTQGYSDGITDVAGDPKNALDAEYIAAIQKALIEKLDNKQINDDGKYYAAFSSVEDLAEFLTGLEVKKGTTLDSTTALQAAKQLTGEIDDGRAGITAGGAIYINAASINVNGKIQSGYENYVLNIKQDIAQGLINAGTPGAEKRPDAEFKTDEYLVTDIEKSGAYYDDTTGKFVYGIKAWYNPTTGQIFTEDIEQAGGGRIYLTGAIANTNASGGKLIVLDGGSRYDIDSTVENMDNRFTLKLGSINAETVEGRIEINDTNTGNKVVYGRNSITTYDKNGKVIDDGNNTTTAYKPDDGQYYIWSNGTANRVTVTYEHVSDTSWFGLAEDKWESAIGSLDEVTKDNMQIGETKTEDTMLPTVGNIITDGSLDKYDYLKDVAGSETIKDIEDADKDVLYQIAFERKGKPKQGVNEAGEKLYWAEDGDGNKILVTKPNENPYYLTTIDENGKEVYVYETIISDKVTTTENKDPLGWWGKTVTTRWKETGGMITAYNFGLKADNSIGIEFVGNEKGSTGDIISNSDILLGGDIHMGQVDITSTTGSIGHIDDATVISDNAAFVAQTGIDVIQKNVNEALHLNAVSAGGDINIQAIAANANNDVYIDNVSTAGNVNITAEGSLLNGDIAANGYAVKGDGITLQSYGGGIDLVIDGGKEGTNAYAVDDISLTEANGHMYLGEIVAEDGNVALKVTGDGAGFVDAIKNNSNENKDSTRIDEWEKLGLLDDGTNDSQLNSKDNQLANLKNAAESGSMFYADGVTMEKAQEQGSDLLDAGIEFVNLMKGDNAEVQAAREDLNAKQGALNEAIADLNDKKDGSEGAYKTALKEYNEAYDHYAQVGADYEQKKATFIENSVFADNEQAVSWLLSYEAIGNAADDNYGWTDKQLLYAVQDTVINPNAGSVSDVKTANVTGNNITFISNTGNLGVVDDMASSISSSDLTKLFTGERPDEHDFLDKLASARAGDVVWGDEKITVRRTTPVSVKLNSDGGTVTVQNSSGDTPTAKHIYLLAKDSVLNADKFAANDLRLSGQKGLNVNEVTGSSIYLEGGSGNIDALDKTLQAVQVELNEGGFISANAAGNVKLQQVGSGNFTLGSVAGTNVNITANGDIVSRTDDISYINASETINLTSGGGIGTVKDGEIEGLRIKNSGAVVNTDVQNAINIEAKQDGMLILGTMEQDTGGVNVDSEGSIYIGHENDPETAENEYVEGYIDAKDDVNLHAAEDIIISGKLHVNKNDGNLNLHADNGDITQTTIDEAENIAVENLTVAAINGNVELANKHNVIGNVDIMAVGGSLGLTVSNPAGFNVDMGGFTNKQGGDIKLTNSDGSVNITTKDIVDQAQKDPANINGSLTVTADKLVEATKANVNNDGILNATGNISFNAEDNVNNEGALVAGRDVSFGAGNDIINNDIVDASRNVNFNAAENIYNMSTVNADETIEFTAVGGVINSDTVNGKDVIMQAIEQELENILAKDSVTLNGDRIHGQNITQNTEADGDLIINTDSNSGSGPIESLVIDKIDANDKSVFTELWAVEADITTVDDKMDFNDIMIEENAWLENSGTLATIYGNVPVKDDDANVHIYQSYPSMYVNFIDADTVETDGRLLSLDDYWYAYDQRFTAENHLRWQHGRYLDEDWKQAYGYGLSLHNRYGLIDYQEFTETNAGADEVAVEA